MFSYHDNRQDLGKGYCYARGWKSYKSSPDIILRALLKVATSPIVFKDGVRSEKNFLRADWVALDFDEGPTLSSITKTFCDCIHVIGTSRNHQKWKGHKSPCDRFRVWLKLEHTITTVADYKATIRKLVHDYEADPACVGAAQLFWPCSAITSVEVDGYTTDVVQAEERPYAETRPVYNRQIPPFVKEWLTNDFVQTDERKGRNFYVLKTAIWLARHGWDEKAIFEEVMGSKLPIDQSPRVQNEVRKAVRSGVRRAREDTREGIKC
jgi:hypothetical protein